MARVNPETLRPASAALMLLAGVGLSTAGFCVPPVGEISDSVLWFTDENYSTCTVEKP